MPFIPAVNTAKVTLYQRLHDQLVTNTMYVRQATPWDVTGLTTLAQAIADWYGSDLSANLSSNIGLERVTARDMTTESSAGIDLILPSMIVGGILSQGAPGNVALTVRLKTGLTGRNFAGRLYLGGIAEDDTEGNAIDLVRLEPILAAFQALIPIIAGLAAEWVVASFYNGTSLVEFPSGVKKFMPVPRATALLTEIITITADAFFDSQRRRLHGRGD